MLFDVHHMNFELRTNGIVLIAGISLLFILVMSMYS